MRFSSTLIHVLIAGGLLSSCESSQVKSTGGSDTSAHACMPVPSRFGRADTSLQQIAANGDTSYRDMVYIAGGEFEMGGDNEQASADEYPKHRVQVSAFYMDETEVTNAQFKAFVDATGYVTTAERKPDWEELRKSLPPGTPKPPDS